MWQRENCEQQVKLNSYRKSDSRSDKMLCFHQMLVILWCLHGILYRKNEWMGRDRDRQRKGERESEFIITIYNMYLLSLFISLSKMSNCNGRASFNNSSFDVTPMRTPSGKPRGKSGAIPYRIGRRNVCATATRFGRLFSHIIPTWSFQTSKILFAITLALTNHYWRSNGHSIASLFPSGWIILISWFRCVCNWTHREQRNLPWNGNSSQSN